MKDENDVERSDAQINGRTEGPFGSDDTDKDRAMEDNRNRYEQENSANGLDSQEVRGGQDGRNNRGIGSTDMDSKNGILRMGDTSTSTLEVTEEGQQAAVADSKKSNTSMVDVTTHGPDDYASNDEVPAPEAQKDAKKQKDTDSEANKSDKAQKEREEDVAETGTDLKNRPVY